MKVAGPGDPCHLATIGIGSNQGDRIAAIQGAIQKIVDREGNSFKACSSFYETEPYGKEDQAWFINCVAQIETTLKLKDFFYLLQEIEDLFGRVRQEYWGPRTLDLDLLFFDNTVFFDSELTVPHPGIPYRRFVLAPLYEIAPGLIHPGLHQSVQTLISRLNDSCQVLCLGQGPDIYSLG